MWNDQPHVVTSGASDRNVVAQSTQFLVFLAGEEVQSNIAKDRGSTPTLAALQDSDVYLSVPPNNMQTSVDELKLQVGPKYSPRFFEWFTTMRKEYELGVMRG